MFKKRVVEKKNNVNEDLDKISLAVDEQQGIRNNLAGVEKSIHTKKINKFSTQVKKEDQVAPEKKPIIVKYGLIDKQEVNSKYHANQDAEEQKPPEKHSIVNLYIKRKMEELAASKQEQNDIHNTNAEEIIQMQKKYLEMGEEKLAEYDIGEILKKLENMATQSIKNQMQNRNSYLRNLLENEHEKMQYASKKELKTIKQQKERLENEFKNKYNEEGRRAFVEKLKFSSMLGK